MAIICAVNIQCLSAIITATVVRLFVTLLEKCVVFRCLMNVKCGIHGILLQCIINLFT